MGRVLDPAGGSWAVERLTDDLAERAWTLFREVEALGGLTRALEAGMPQRRVAETADARAAAYATRKSVLIGTNRYPKAGEKIAPAAGEGADAASGAASATNAARANAPGGASAVRNIEPTLVAWWMDA